MSLVTADVTHFPSEDKPRCEDLVTISSETKVPWYEKKCLCVYACGKRVHMCVSDSHSFLREARLWGTVVAQH